VGNALGLDVYAQAWIGADLAANAQEVANLIQIGQSGQAKLLIVGSEALLRNDVSESQLLGYINQVKQAVPGVNIAYSDTYGVMLAHPNVTAAIDVLLPTIYSYWEGIPIGDAVAAVADRYGQVVAASGSKSVIIGETGWPSDGQTVGGAVPSAENQRIFVESFLAWAQANNVPYLYFAAFDEAWKQTYEGPTGAHWGLFDTAGVLKPGLESVITSVPEPELYVTMTIGLLLICVAARRSRAANR
jgi:exo-beta-1,3-glucanase (GH17 family)